MNGSETFPSVIKNTNFLVNITQGYVPLWTQVLYLSYIGLIFLSGIPGNLFIIIVYIRTKPKKSCDWFILFIGFTDFIVCLVSPFLSFHMELGIKVPHIDGLMCGLEHLWQLTAMTSSCFILAFMSIERYIRVCHPTKKSFTPLMSRNISISCIILAFLCSTYPSTEQFSKDTCSHIGNDSGMPLPNLYIYFAIYMLCFITVAFAYVRVILTIEEKIKVKQRLINNSGMFDRKPDSQKETKVENAYKITNGKEKTNIGVDEPSDKNDSGFNQIDEPQEPNVHQHENCLAQDKREDETLAVFPQKGGNSAITGDKNLPVIYLTEDSGEHPPESATDSQCLKSNVIRRIDEEVVDPKDSEVINITINPFFSNSLEFNQNESDVDLIEDAAQSPELDIKANGERLLSAKEETDGPDTPSEPQKPSDQSERLIASPEKPDKVALSKQGSVTRRSAKEMSHLGTSVDCDYVDEDLYSDVGQPVPFFQKAKKAMCEKIASTKKKRSENSRRKRWLQERQVTIMLVTITAVFLGTWIPPWLFYLLATHGILIFPPGVPTRIMYRHWDKIFLINYVCNFPIYYRFNRTFRMKTKAVIPKWFRKYCFLCCFHNLDNDN